MNKERAVEMAKQSLAITGYISVIGLISYFVMMIPQVIAQTIGGGTGAGENAIVVSNIITAVVGMFVCFVSLYVMLKAFGKNDCVFLLHRTENEAQVKYSYRYAMIGIGLAIVIFEVVNFVMNIGGWPFLSGPGYYLTRIFYATIGTLAYDTSSSDIVKSWAQYAGSFLYIGLMVPAMLFGYKKGFEERRTSGERI